MLLLASSSATIDEKHPPKDNASNKKIDTQTCAVVIPMIQLIKVKKMSFHLGE